MSGLLPNAMSLIEDPSFRELLARLARAPSPVQTHGPAQSDGRAIPLNLPGMERIASLRGSTCRRSPL